MDWEQAAKNYDNFAETSMEGLWKGVKALGDWFGIGTMVNSWINQAREKKYGYKDLIDKLMRKIDTIPVPQNKSAQLSTYLSNLQNALFSIDGNAANKIGTKVRQLESKINTEDIKYQAALAKRDSVINSATRKVNEIQDLATSGDIDVNSEINNLAKETEEIISKG